MNLLDTSGKRRAVQVSNHGGCALDGTLAPLIVLAAIADEVMGKVPIIMYGGTRRGTDVVDCMTGQAPLIDCDLVYR